MSPPPPPHPMWVWSPINCGLEGRWWESNNGNWFMLFCNSILDLITIIFIYLIIMCPRQGDPSRLILPPPPLGDLAPANHTPCVACWWQDKNSRNKLSIHPSIPVQRQRLVSLHWLWMTQEQHKAHLAHTYLCALDDDDQGDADREGGHGLWGTTFIWLSFESKFVIIPWIVSSSTRGALIDISCCPLIVSSFGCGLNKQPTE